MAGLTPVDPQLLERARGGDKAAVESVLATMATSAKATRTSPSRWLWRAAVIAGVLGLVGFALLVSSSASGHAPSATTSSPPGHDLPIGILMGLAAGVAIGWTLGRSRPASSR